MANHDNYCKIDGEGAFVYGMLRHFTYVAGVFRFFFSFLSPILLYTLAVLPMIVGGILHWQAEEAAKGRKRSFLGWRLIHTMGST